MPPDAERVLADISQIPRRARFGRRLKILRITLGIAQGELARELGVSQNTVCRLEGGHTTYLAFDVVFELIAFLARHGYNAEWLVADAPPPTDPRLPPGASDGPPSLRHSVTPPPAAERTP